MATASCVWYRYIDNNSGGYISSGENIYSDIVAQCGASSFTEIDVQAPPGTQMVLNSTKDIMIGRTGAYGLHDDDITITSMYFVQPKNYVKDTDASDEAKTNGAAAMEAAETAREEALYDLNVNQGYEDEDGNVLKTKDESYWSTYNSIQDTFETAYEAAFATYTSGINGIYVQDSTTPYKELENVVIYYKYV